MNFTEATKIFEELISLADKELHEFTQNNTFNIETKADKTLVSDCDKNIDQILSAKALEYGFQIVSEEGEHSLEIIKNGNYMTIDPIDGTLGYIDYVNHWLQDKNQKFLSQNLGPEHDFCLLVGIVENGKPRFGMLYNYITKEKIIVDAENKENLIRENYANIHNEKYAIYIDPRGDNEISKKFVRNPEVSIIRHATVGMRSVYSILNNHESSNMHHSVQFAGLWDILPAACAAKAFGAKIYDGNWNPLKLDEYIILPKTGVNIIKGEFFRKLLIK